VHLACTISCNAMSHRHLLLPLSPTICCHRGTHPYIAGASSMCCIHQPNLWTWGEAFGLGKFYWSRTDYDAIHVRSGCARAFSQVSQWHLVIFVISWGYPQLQEHMQNQKEMAPSMGVPLQLRSVLPSRAQGSAGQSKVSLDCTDHQAMGSWPTHTDAGQAGPDKAGDQPAPGRRLHCR
jgi:hypothetical protein